jgi:hypothetical protein
MIYSKRRKNLGGGEENAPIENLLCLIDFAVLEKDELCKVVMNGK